MMKRAILWGLLSLSLVMAAGIAEALPPTPPLTAQLAAAGTPVSFSATTSSGSTPITLGATPANFPVDILVNNGGAEAFCSVGGTAVTVSTNSYLVAIPAGGMRWFWDNADTKLVCVTGSSTATVRASQSTGAPGAGTAAADSAATGVISGNVGVLNTSSVQIDPATSEAQATNIAAIQETHATLGSTATKVEATQMDNVADGPVVTASVTSATSVITYAATAGYASIEFGFTSIGATNTIVVDAAVDGSTYNGVVPIVPGNSTSPPGTSVSPQTAQVYCAPVSGQAERIRVSVYGSGTVTAYAALKRGACGNYSSAGTTVGNIASAAADSGNPVKVGGKYNTTSLALTTGNRSDLQVSGNGALVMQEFAAEALRWQASVSLSATGNNVLDASCGVGLRNYITHFDWSGVATTVANQIEILDGASTVIVTDNIPAGATGRDHNYNSPFRGSAATALNVAITGTPTGAVQVNASGYCAP